LELCALQIELVELQRHLIKNDLQILILAGTRRARTARSSGSSST